MQHLYHQAERGDVAAEAELQKMVQAYKQIWEPLVDLSGSLEDRLLELIAAGDPALQAALRMKVTALRESVQEATADVLDDLLVDELVVCWLDAAFTHMAAIQPQQHLRDRKYWEQRYERAHARYLGVIREIEELRALRNGAPSPRREGSPFKVV